MRAAFQDRQTRALLSAMLQGQEGRAAALLALGKGPGGEPNSRALQREPGRYERRTRNRVSLDVRQRHVARREFELAGLASSAELRWVRERGEIETALAVVVERDRFVSDSSDLVGGPFAD
jgi:hypothetical protein